uniref:Cation-transporting P-type ATPase N-terminal domain-containing protein n=1 Tax=Panagrolaimus sp. JU765 TaxID=591449 RepID=A0AC34QUH5_9BILA
MKTNIITKLFSRFFRNHVHPLDEETPEDRRQILGNSFVEHHLTLDELIEVYYDSYIDKDNPEKSDGLSSFEAKKRLKDGGKNIIKIPKKDSNIKLFARQFLNKFWILLIGAALLCLVTYFFHVSHGVYDTLNLYCAGILIGIVLCMSILSYWQEKKAISVISDFDKLLPQTCCVIRDAVERSVKCEDLVVGDIVKIQSGQRIPAGIRLLQANGLKIESFAISGDNTPSTYTTEPAA